MRKKLPIGVDGFEKIRTNDFYYVDKTMFIAELLRNWGEVNLFTRPRRFGKTLNMSMLKCFFEVGSDPSLFDGLAIAGERELCEKYRGQFPVIFITLKNVEGLDYASACNRLINQVGNEALRFEFLRESQKLSQTEKEKYAQLVNLSDGTGNQAVYAMSEDVLTDSLRTLSQLLSKHYGKKVILLIDEYDVPLDQAFQKGYYVEMVSLLRSLFGSAVKTNPDLHFAVLTGCLRIAKESIFTGLNNLKVFSGTAVRFGEYFGFTDQEVQKILAYYGFEARYETVKNWYDGYRFGNVEVYCPWDVISYCDDLMDDDTIEPKNYWVNTSGNNAIRYLIHKLGNGVLKSEIEMLVSGETVEKEIYEDLTYNEIYSSVNHVWSLLFMTGYLTRRGTPEGKRMQLAIPNREIRSIFVEQIMSLFRENVAQDGKLLGDFCDALEQGDVSRVEKLFDAYLEKTISIRDTFVRKATKENFYHGILLGILGYKDGWILKSNKEAGNGYSDISIWIADKWMGIVIEVKYAERQQLEAVCQEALAQIDRNGYADSWKREGCQTILKYGMACNKKECRVLVEKEMIKNER